MILYLATNDLRWHDHPGLAEAFRLGRERGEEVRICGIRPDGWDAVGVGGIVRYSARRREFWLSSWKAFVCGAAVRGVDAWLVDGELIEGLERFGGASMVVVTAAFAWNERQRERRWAAVCRERGIGFRLVEGHDLFDEAGLGFGLADLPKTFTPFRQRVERAGRLIDEATVVERLGGGVDGGSSAGWGDGEGSFPWGGSEAEALGRLRWYVWETDGLRRYKETRNGLMGSDFSGKFSPWLATGALSVRRIWRETLRHEVERGATDGTVWMRVELLWRSYFLWNARRCGAALFRLEGWNGRGGGMFSACGHDGAAFAAWCEGRTGDGLVDAGMRELVATGFLSNRVRQNAASFLIHDLGCDWRFGAAFFEGHLLDYEAGSNWGNWAYIAGVGSDPRPVRRFNTREQAERYDADGRYRRRWLG
jgi:deoxyribodipyrimidine photo-lyase